MDVTSALLAKCFTWWVSLQEPEGTTNVFCMNAIGLSGIIPARGPREQATATSSFSAAHFARRMPPPRMYTYDHIFRSCQHPLLTRARHDSDTCLRLLPLPTNLDPRLLPALLQILASEDGHGICFSNWSTSQISQLDQVPQPIDTVPALNESLLALSKHFFNRIDNKRSTPMPSPQTLKPTPPLAGFFRNDVTNLVSSPRYPPYCLFRRPARSCPIYTS